MKPIIVIVAGGSGSGKTTVVTKIVEAIKRSTDIACKDITVIKHDDYYKSNSEMPLCERVKVNYDHPDSIDNDLLYSDLVSLLDGREIEMPTYDFINHTRGKETNYVLSTKVIILEGILALQNKKIRDLADFKLYVESDDDTRFIRRLVRDMNERGRSLESVITQYVSTVKPMYYKYVKPSKRYADIIIPNEKKHDVAVSVIVSKVKEIMRA